MCVKRESHEFCLHPDGRAGPRKDNASIVKQKANCFRSLMFSLTLLLLGNGVLDEFEVRGNKKKNLN